MIESLSDSTIYMAYYVVSTPPAGRRQLVGRAEGTLRHRSGRHVGCSVGFHLFRWRTSKEQHPRREFEAFAEGVPVLVTPGFACFWQGPDPEPLNHVPHNHASIWSSNLWPRAIFCNGLLLVNNEKMSKAKGSLHAKKI